VTSEAQTPLAIEVAKLGVKVEGSVLLRDVDLAVRQGSIHLLLGPNGAGKSTLVAALLGRLPFSGAIKLHWRGNGRVGFVPQSFHADRTLPITVAEFLSLSRQSWPVCFGLRPETRREVTRLLSQVGMDGMESRRLGVLSGGELRRVLIANAISPAPELLILDEPATGLDAAAVASLDALLLSLRAREGTTIFMISHDLTQVRRIADTVTFLDQTVVETGAIDPVLAAAGLHALGSSVTRSEG